MGSNGTGTIYIPLEEFWEFVKKYAPDAPGAEIVYGVPHVQPMGCDLVVDFAFSTECHPSKWMGEKPAAVTQWDAINKPK